MCNVLVSLKKSELKLFRWNCSILSIHCLVKRVFPLLSFTQQTTDTWVLLRRPCLHRQAPQLLFWVCRALLPPPPPPILLLVTDLFCWMFEDCCSRLFTVTDLGFRLAQRWELCLVLRASVSSVEHLVSSCILPPSMHINPHGDLYWLLASFLLLRIGSSCVCVGGRGLFSCPTIL